MTPTSQRPKVLSDVQIRNCKPDGTRRRLYDERGLYLEVAPGGGKWWRFKYRFDGKEKLIGLDVYPDVPLAGRWLDEAKRKCRDMSGYFKVARPARRSPRVGRRRNRPER